MDVISLKDILDLQNFRPSLAAFLAGLLFTSIILSISSQAATVAEHSTSGMGSTWVIDLIIIKLEGFHW